MILADKNRQNWDDFADKYSAFSHTRRKLERILHNPMSAFHPVMRDLLKQYMFPIDDLRVCVPSSGDNHAALAFAALGARVTSCDISAKQLANARRAAETCELADRMTFVQTDTRTLAGVQSAAYDIVFTSNGVHVWIDDLPAMYESIARVLRPGGKYAMREIHPFQRPFGERAKVFKPYDATGPFEDENSVTFHWRVQDILNAMLGAGLRLMRLEETFAEKNYDEPFFVPIEKQIKGEAYPRELIDQMYDWRHNPIAALPNWLCVVAQKEDV